MNLYSLKEKYGSCAENIFVISTKNGRMRNVCPRQPAKRF
jgi:hypothetical protein